MAIFSIINHLCLVHEQCQRNTHLNNSSSWADYRPYIQTVLWWYLLVPRALVALVNTNLFLEASNTCIACETDEASVGRTRWHIHTKFQQNWFEEKRSTPQIWTELKSGRSHCGGNYFVNKSFVSFSYLQYTCFDRNKGVRRQRARWNESLALIVDIGKWISEILTV